MDKLGCAAGLAIVPRFESDTNGSSGSCGLYPEFAMGGKQESP